MWFKNLQLLRLMAWDLTLDALLAKMEPGRMAPVGKMNLGASGWVPPREGGELAEQIGDAYLIALGTESKVLPGNAIKKLVKERARELEEQQGFKPGRKQLRELKEQITDELLPTALVTTSRTQILIDPVNGWVMIDAAGKGSYDTALRFIIRSLALAIDTLFTKQNPVSQMTLWLTEDWTPEGFTVDDEFVLKSGMKGTLTLKNVGEEVAQRHVQAGATVRQMALTFNDKISFVLNESLVLKRLAPLDVAKESAKAVQDADRFTAEGMIMVDTLRGLVSALVGDVLGVAERGEGQAQAELKEAA
jgi:recombination associated protein RdgC